MSTWHGINEAPTRRDNNYYPVAHKKRLDMPADGEQMNRAANDERAAKWQ